MQLEPVAHYNNLSAKLREEIEAKLKGFGKSVRYKFEISKPNPDPAKYNGDTVWPNRYTLDPAVWDITDPHETAGKSKSKKIGIVEAVDENGKPNRFRKIRVMAPQKGVLILDLENQDDYYTAFALELHPKLIGGKFEDKNAYRVVTRIDENAEAETKRKERTARKKALDAAEEMSDQDIVNFADAMMWDSGEPANILRNKVEELAETDPEFFNDLIEKKEIQVRALVKQALDKRIITHDPVENKFMWASNMQLITALPTSLTANHVQQFAEWLVVGGAKAEEVHKKIKELSKAPLK